ncbi:RDD family protein [Mariprofundus ferrooxydans]|uniref:RDD family protein n=1 Tax=Mariprofundus ferrooxydans TaxID=314344 RepID=UPI00142FBA30|nr:RDD family protein [Mariprofundus ferrooxydans]
MSSDRMERDVAAGKQNQGDAPAGEEGRPQVVLAGIMVRFAAAVYDLGLVFALAFLIFIPITAAEQALGSMPQWIKGVLALTIFWAYFTGFWSRSGETTGMRPWRLLVVTADDGEFPTSLVASIRFAVLMLTWLASAFVMLSILTGKTQNTIYATVALLPLLSLVCLALTKKRQALHDLLAGCIVVRQSAAEKKSR